ncbi:hypothetical protein JQU93_09315 [Sulfitobacter mediterraneus]|nr:hypothetical protein [Sulfitobacter mediterraneus]MBM1405637.1 hypothetical protein [Sulfitobacter mediterraneus]MBM1498367.1 hypothetical protein [Sulfitobacter mediterraneus]MBM1514296.1 hypothetical protein [Sulfitobacter mediterraneus]MBM1541344.1 hypothetical protein [Sulfitobacter mediterraneus]
MIGMFMNQCILCKAELTLNEKPEHILLDALGGRATTKEVICSACNNEMGSGPDKDLAESVASLRTIANLKSGSRKKAPSLSVSPGNGDAYELHPTGNTTPKIQKALDLGQDEDGNPTLSISARDEQHLENLLEAAAKALAVPPEKHDAFKDMVRKDAVVKSTPAAAFSSQLALGSKKSLEAMAKACLVLWAKLIGNSEVCDTRYDEIRDFIRKSKQPTSEAKNFGTDTRPFSGSSSRFGENANIVWVGSNDQGAVRGYFRLYGAVGWTFCLCEKSEFRNRSIVLISDPLDQSRWVCGEEHGHLLNYEWVGERPSYDEIDWDEPKRKFGLIMAHGHEQMLETAFDTIVRQSFDDFGIEEGASVPPDMIEKFSSRLAHKFAYLVTKQPYEEPYATKPRAGSQGTNDNET